MNNKVKPQAGQVFKLVRGLSGFTLDETITADERLDGTVKFTLDRSGAYTFFSDKEVAHYFEFVAQNDLEWLTVNIEVWNANTHMSVFKKDGGCGYGFVLAGGCDSYNHSKWQECRYSLGLDDRPQQEEVIMYFMEGKVVGDQFKYYGQVATLAYISKSGNRFVLDSASGGVIVCNENGKGCTSDDFQLEKHDPRPWLKDLPDASLLSCEVVGIGKLKDHDGGYWYFVHSSDSSGDDRRFLPLSDMPMLSDKDCETSEISIADLAKWQAENK